MNKTYRCWAEIDLNALRGNLAWIRHRVGPGVKVVTVVKADAYGHGLKQIAGLLMQSGTDVFGVANLAEAAAIRSVGKGWPILMLGACLPEEVEMAVRDHVMPTISSTAEARLFSNAAARQGRVAAIHVKIDTGMGRLGVGAAEAQDLIQQIEKLPSVRLAGICTHYAAAEDDIRFSREQHQRFRRALEPILKKPSTFEYLHVNNSAAILFEPSSVYNTVRPGLLVYGVAPSTKRVLPPLLKKHLQPALTWKARISLVKTIPARTPLSYGRSFVSTKRMRIATVTAGYGDGYMRAASNRARVLIRGHRCPVVGRVTMDQMLVDVTRAGGADVSDEVVLIGTQGRDAITANELAQWCGTVPWEILTNISYRVPRIYVGYQAA
jgi:alanine racemase